MQDDNVIQFDIDKNLLFFVLYKIFDFFLKRCNHFCRFFCDSLFNFYFTVAFGSLCSSDADCQHHYHAPPDGEVYCHNIYSHIGRCQIRTSKYKSNIFLLNKFDIFLSNLIESQHMKKEKTSLNYHNCLFFR